GFFPKKREKPWVRQPVPGDQIVWTAQRSFHKGDLFRPYTPASYVPPFRSNSCPPQNDSRHGYPDRPRSNPGTPVSSRGNHDPRRQIYDLTEIALHSSTQGATMVTNHITIEGVSKQGNRSQYNSSSYQGN
ncbi:unnamed protein product, partial [Porites evermanni]